MKAVLFLLPTLLFSCKQHENTGSCTSLSPKKTAEANSQLEATIAPPDQEHGHHHGPGGHTHHHEDSIQRDRIFTYLGVPFEISAGQTNFDSTQLEEISSLLSRKEAPKSFSSLRDLVSFHSSLEVPGGSSAAGPILQKFHYLSVDIPLTTDTRVIVYQKHPNDTGYKLRGEFVAKRARSLELNFSAKEGKLECRGNYGSGPVLWQER